MAAAPPARPSPARPSRSASSGAGRNGPLPRQAERHARADRRADRRAGRAARGAESRAGPAEPDRRSADPAARVRRAAAAIRARAALVATVGLVLAAAPAQAQAPDRPPPVPGADAAIVVDGRDGDVMFAKNANERQSIASTTKLMTALLTLDGARPREVFTAADYIAAPVESQIGLRPGERMTVRRPVRRAPARERQRRRRDARRGRLGLGRRVRRGHERARRGARPRGHELREPDRLRRPAQLLDPERPGDPHAGRCCAGRGLRARSTCRRPTSSPARARARSTTATRSWRPTRS